MPRVLVLFTAMCLVALGLVVNAFAGSAFPGDKAERMEASELLAKIDSPDIVIIDVRRGKDFNGSELMIKNAVRKAYNDVDSWAGEYNMDKTLVLYCAWHDEYTSARVARTLMQKGFMNVYALKGGWNDWEVNGYPTQKK